VSTRQFDVGVVEMPVSRPAIDIEELGSSRPVVVLPAGHRLASLDRITMTDLDGERMVLLSPHSYVRYQIDDAFASAGAAPVTAAETPSASIACALVAAGAGVTIVSRSTAQPFMSADTVVRLLDAPIAFRYSMVFPQLTTRSSLSDAFAADLRTELREAAD